MTGSRSFRASSGSRSPRFGSLSFSGSFRRSRGRCGLLEPICKTRLAELRTVPRNECAFAQLRAEVACVRVGDHLARIVACAEALSEEIIEAELFGSAYFNCAVQRRSYRDP